jgi:hypothetical protein
MCRVTARVKDTGRAGVRVVRAARGATGKAHAPRVRVVRAWFSLEGARWMRCLGGDRSYPCAEEGGGGGRQPPNACACTRARMRARTHSNTHTPHTHELLLAPNASVPLASNGPSSAPVSKCDTKLPQIPLDARAARGPHVRRWMHARTDWSRTHGSVCSHMRARARARAHACVWPHDRSTTSTVACRHDVPRGL